MLLTRVAGSMDRRRGKLQGSGQLRDLAVVRGQVKCCTKLLHILCKCSVMQTPRDLHADLEQSSGFCGNEFCMSNEIIPTLFCLVEVSLLLLIEDYYTKFTLCDFIFCLYSLWMSVNYIIQTLGQYCKSKTSHASALSDFLQLYR